MKYWIYFGNRPPLLAGEVRNVAEARAASSGPEDAVLERTASTEVTRSSPNSVSSRDAPLKVNRREPEDKKRPIQAWHDPIRASVSRARDLKQTMPLVSNTKKSSVTNDE